MRVLSADKGITPGRTRAAVLTASIDVIGFADAVACITSWAREKSQRYVCACNVHSVVLAWLDPSMHRVVEDADLALPDGMPVAWVLRSDGYRGQPRICGPDLMWRTCEAAAQERISIFLLGSTPQVLNGLQYRLKAAFPNLAIAGTQSPPFRVLTDEEDRAIVQTINDSGAGLVFVAFGCPTQERWMAAHRASIHATMVGVGAAFDFHAGVRRRAPPWMQRLGLEWLHRLAGEPRRLWRRYLVSNPLFIAGFLLHRVRRLHGSVGREAGGSPGVAAASARSPFARDTDAERQ